MTPARRLWPDPYASPLVRHRWMFVTFVVVWILLVVAEIFLVIWHFWDHVPFGSTFWVLPVMLGVTASTLIRTNRFRMNARSAAALDRSRH